MLGVVITVVSFVLFTAAIVYSLYLCNKAIIPRIYSYDETYNKETNLGRFNREEFENLPRKEVNIKSPYGYNLFGYFFAVEGSKKTVIICHGHKWTLFGSVKYLNMFLKRGYNVLVYDHRYHGKSGGTNTTFGFYEKNDLKACVDWVVENCGADCIIGTMGESMGGAVVLQHAAIDSRVSFCISDCSYSKLTDMFKLRLKEDYHLPAFPFLYIASLIAGIRTGFFFHNTSPIEDIAKVETPVLFIHGQKDAYIPKEMSIRMYNTKKGIKELYLAPNAGHAESYINNKDEYETRIDKFLSEAGLNF